jgi:hypothetical protein
MAHKKPKKAQLSTEQRPPAALRLAAATRRGLLVPQAELAGGAVQQVVERLHQREVRAQPAAVQPPVLVGHGHETAHQQQRGQHAAQDDGQRGLRGGGFAAHKGVDAQAPLEAQHPELGFGEVEAQQVQRRSAEKEREESRCRARRQRCRRFRRRSSAAAACPRSKSALAGSWVSTGAAAGDVPQTTSPRSRAPLRSVRRPCRRRR